LVKAGSAVRALGNGHIGAWVRGPAETNAGSDDSAAGRDDCAVGSAFEPAPVESWPPVGDGEELNAGLDGSAG
jgi:hypothetical protein